MKMVVKRVDTVVQATDRHAPNGPILTSVLNEQTTRPSGAKSPSGLINTIQNQYKEHRALKTSQNLPYCVRPWLPIQYLNGNAQFKNGSLMWCRHISVYRALKMLAGKITDHEEFADSELMKISMRTEEKLQKAYKNVATRSTENHLIDNKKLGLFLSNQFQSMDQNREESKVMVIFSQDHVMNFFLRIKVKDGIKSYVTQFYDPNYTNSHMRCALGQRESYKHQNLSDYLRTDSDQAKYYRNEPGSGISHIAVLDRNIDYYSDPLFPSPARKMVMHDCGYNPTSFCYLLQHSGYSVCFPENIKAFKADLVSGRLSFGDEKLVQILAALNPVSGEPGIVAAMAHGHPEVIEAWGEILQRLPPEMQVELLAARTRKGLPGICLALHYGKPEVIKTWGTILNKLPPEMQVRLLAAEAPKQNMPADAPKYDPGIVLAIREGHAAAIKEWGGIVALLPPHSQYTLLASVATRIFMELALSRYKQKDTTEVIAAWREIVERLPSDMQAKLLADLPVVVPWEENKKLSQKMAKL
ncbi:MAG: ShET2/EspL2 family type III secretion system effector toxin [Burkholderiaceae bacterium]